MNYFLEQMIKSKFNMFKFVKLACNNKKYCLYKLILIVIKLNNFLFLIYFFKYFKINNLN